MNTKNLLNTMIKANTDIYDTITEFCMTDNDRANIDIIKQKLRGIAYTLLSVSENIYDETIDKRTIITEAELMI